MKASQRWQLQQALWKRGVRVGVLEPTLAPSIATYPVMLPDDTEASDVDRKLKEIAGRMGVKSIRGAWLDNGLYSLELPRAKRQRVDYGRLELPDDAAPLPWLLGIDNSGGVLIADVSTMPHMLIAGTTGAGKSTSVTASLAHLLTVRSPDQVQTLLLDPKQLDLVAFARLPHTVAHLTQADVILSALESLIDEMHHRNSLFAKARVKNLAAYNAKGHTLPAIVCIIDELGLLMDTYGKALEPILLALLQTARASGIHLIVGTQRPDENVLKPRLRANLPTVICFAIEEGSSQHILKNKSAAGLLGAGDGLYKNKSGITRFQSPFIDDTDERALQKVLMRASKQPASMWTLNGVQDTSDVVQSLEGLSQIDAAVLLCDRLDWINSSALIDAGVCDSDSMGKKLIRQLRKRGLVGAYDASQKASPIRHEHDTPDTARDGHDGLVPGTVTVDSPSSTQRDGYDGLKNLRPRVVN
ncbi:MAG: FtsK/SpoIIIE domain-containing protein [Deinococcota bacterium]